LIEIGNVFSATAGGKPLGNAVMHERKIHIECNYSGGTDYWRVWFTNLIVVNRDGAERILYRDYTESYIEGQLQTSGANGLDINSPPTSGSTWVHFHLYIIFNSRTNIVATMASLTNGIPILPSGYDFYRRVGVLLYYNPDGSTHRAIASMQDDDYFYPIEKIKLYNAQLSPATWSADQTATQVPSTAKTMTVTVGCAYYSHALGICPEVTTLFGITPVVNSIGCIKGSYSSRISSTFGLFDENFQLAGTFRIPVKYSSGAIYKLYENHETTLYPAQQTITAYLIAWQDDINMYY
jgi:hypothetical protein